jgi:hypothetical protein
MRRLCLPLSSALGIITRIKLMGIFSFFKKHQIPLQVGETKDDRIGCYLFGTESPGEKPFYHSVATNREELLEDCLEFFTLYANQKKELIAQGTPTAPRHAHDLAIIENAINKMPMFIEMHLKYSNGSPFFEFPGIKIFLKTGERRRQKLRGKYTE